MLRSLAGWLWLGNTGASRQETQEAHSWQLCLHRIAGTFHWEKTWTGGSFVAKCRIDICICMENFCGLTVILHSLQKWLGACLQAI